MGRRIPRSDSPVEIRQAFERLEDSFFDDSSDVDHDATTNFVAAEHVDHSAVSITAGIGLTGGGTIEASRTLSTEDSEIVHNDLASLQGGTANQYYHLTSSEHAELAGWMDDVTLSDGGDIDLGSGALSCTDADFDGDIIQTYAKDTQTMLLHTDDWTKSRRYTGLFPATSETLTSDISAGIAYIYGKRIVKEAESHTYSPSKDTYVDLREDGTYLFSEVGGGSPPPPISERYLRLAKVVTDEDNITSVTNTDGECLFWGLGCGIHNPAAASWNFAFGFQCLEYLTTGFYNCAMGYRAARSNATGHDNVAMGNYTLYYNASGDYNVALGTNSMYLGNGQDRNMAIGYGTLYKTTAGGNDNVGIGWAALYDNTTGSNNVCIGSGAKLSNATANNNVAIGKDALRTNITGAGNVAIGYQAGYNETGSNKLYIQNSDSATPLVYGEFDNRLIRFGEDNTKTYWGTGNDASIYYDGANMVFDSQETGTGDFSFINGQIYSTTYWTDQSGKYALRVQYYPSTTDDATQNYRALSYVCEPSVSSGKTNSGIIASVWGQVLPRDGLEGTLAKLWGINLYCGIAADATGTVSETVGLRIKPYCQSGTITNYYAIYLASIATGGTITTQWSLVDDSGGTWWLSGDNQKFYMGGATTDLELYSDGDNAVLKSSGDVFLDAGGNVKFGTHAAIGAETVTGYITIKDAAGNSRKLAVVS